MLSQSTKPSRLKTKLASSDFVGDGTRFLKDGHWWEVDDHITGKEGAYYRCHPVCNIESRFFTHAEVQHALSHEKTLLRMKARTASREQLSNSVGRGSGRIGQLIPISQAKRPPVAGKHASASEPTCKLLVIGSRNSIQNTIQSLHTLGFAHATDWSPIQRKPKSTEFMSIFTGHHS